MKNDKTKNDKIYVYIEATPISGLKVAKLPKPAYFFKKFISQLLQEVRANKPSNNPNAEKPKS